jgi:uncharacterized membrane protein YdfJ with MMPL/SSD domain
MSSSNGLVRLSRFSLRHRKLVVFFWLVVTAVGMATSGKAFNAFSDQYSVPGREGYETNASVTRSFGNGGNSAPIVAVVSLPAHDTVQTPAVRAALERIDARVLATGLGAGILVDATVIRALLVPAAVSLFGRWNWWLPRAPARPLRVEASPQRLLADHD